MNAPTLSVERVFPSGAWRVSAIVAGHLVTRTYLYYTKRQAVAMFRADIQGGR